MKAPEKIPEDMLDAFTMQGMIRIKDQYIDQASSEKQEELYKQYSNFDELVEKAKRKEMHYYHMTDLWLYKALDTYYNEGDKALIIGSTIPWYEAILTSYGCTDITVSEYGNRPFDYKNITYLKPDELLEDAYDICISISSHEHCGLGRYGDPLDPEGDLKALRDLKRNIRQGGILCIAVPIGLDTLVWNAHRIYGVHRLATLFDGWNVMGSVGVQPELLNVDRGIDGSYQPVWILKNET